MTEGVHLPDRSGRARGKVPLLFRNQGTTLPRRRPPCPFPRAPTRGTLGPVLEIAFLVWLAYKLAADAASKGRSPAWGGLGVLSWLGGEGVGFGVGLAAGAGRGAALAGVACAALGAIAAYAFVRSLPRLPDGAQAP